MCKQGDSKFQAIERAIDDCEKAERQVDVAVAVLQGAKLSVAKCAWQLKALVTEGGREVTEAFEMSFNFSDLLL